MNIGKLKNEEKLLFTLILILSSVPAYSQEIYSININKVCSEIVGIPYASDDFSDLEWQQFKDCLEFIKKYK